MSVYKRRGTYHYDFWLQGHRFSGDTKRTTKREAKAFEDTRRAQAQVELSQREEFVSVDMTFEVAASRWWIEVGQHNSPSGHKTTARNIEWLKRQITPSRPLVQIDDNLVAQLVSKRRGEHIKGKRKLPRVSPATVNRTCIQPLREIVLRARDVWKVKVGDVSFGKHMLPEPIERVREASVAEETAIMGELQRGYDVAVRFAFLSGCRRMEILGLRWTDVDFFSRRFTVLGKGGKVRPIPMSQAIHDLLWAEKNNDPDHVFTFIAAQTRKYGETFYIRGKRYPLRESGLKSAMRRAVPNAEVSNFHFHDTRHTAATRALRKSNLRVVQKLLGHSSVQTTTKYAHALDDDIRNALDASAADSPTASPTKRLLVKRKILGRKEKSK